MAVDSDNACYHSVQYLAASHLLSKNVKSRIYKTITLPVVLHGRDAWFLTLIKEYGRRLFENRTLRIYGSEIEVIGGWRKRHNEVLNKFYS
jgi:hypothetical protein